MSDYFSDRESGPRARIEQLISPAVWPGIVAMIEGLLQSAAFGARFPQSCPDGQALCGHDAQSPSRAVKAFMLGLDWPLQMDQDSAEQFTYLCRRKLGA